MRRPGRRSYSADQLFPCAFDAVAQNGVGHQLSNMNEWLRANISLGAFWVSAEVDAETSDAALFYFLDFEGAKAFVDRFSPTAETD